MANITAIVFARFNSSRLPGKVLYKLGDNTILEIIIAKLARLEGLNIIVATSREKTDDPITNLCDKLNVGIYRGSLEDVAERTRNCIELNPCDVFFRINADSPFIQIDLISMALNSWLDSPKFDIISNTFTRSFPYGIAVELVRSEVFLNNVDNFDLMEREHILSYFYENSDQFLIKQIINTEDQSSARFVLDTKEDWEIIKRLYEFDNNIFNYSLDQLIAINNKI